MYTLKEIFEQTVRRHPGREALVCPQQGLRLTYEQWEGQVNQLANAMLKSGIAKGDRISTFLYNTGEFATTMLAAAKVGAVFNPVNYRLSPAELAFILNDSESKLLVFEDAVKDKVARALPLIKTVKMFLYAGDKCPEVAVPFQKFYQYVRYNSPPVQVSENDWCSIIYTSGTTGKPKGVIHRHRDILDHSMCMIESQKLTYLDRGLSVSPLYHAAELHCFFLPRLHVGAANVLLHHFNQAEVLDTLAREQITVMFGDPPTWRQMLQGNMEECLTHLRLLAYGGAPMPTEVLGRLSKKENVKLVHYYGMTEMGPAVTVSFPGENPKKAGSVGKPLLNHEIRVVRPDEGIPSNPDNMVPAGVLGEVLVRGTGMMQGYYNHPEVTAEAFYGGWYHTGDLGRVDEDGYIWILDRLDDVIVPGVDNVYPREIELQLLEHPDVIEAAVLGLAQEGCQEKIITAHIFTKNRFLTAEMLEEFLIVSDKLAPFKLPRRYIFMPEMPKTATGKIRKYLLNK